MDTMLSITTLWLVSFDSVPEVPAKLVGATRSENDTSIPSQRQLSLRFNPQAAQGGHFHWHHHPRTSKT